MRDSATGQMIRTLQENPASAMCFTPTHGLLKSAFWNNVPIGIGVSTTHWAPNKELYYKSRQTFIDTVIEIANAYYSPIRNKAKYHLSIFPQEILFMIILEYGKIALGMNNNDVFKCFKLILQNFEIRRYLITQGKYVPTAEVTRDSVLNAGEGIWKWWSQTTHDKSQEKIFRTSFHTTLFKPSIREKEPLSKPAKEEHSHQKKYRKRCLLM